MSNTPEILLVYPPFARPSEPPLGLATVAGALKRAGVEYEVLDLNAEAFHVLLCPDFPSPKPSDTFSRRSLNRLQDYVHKLCSPAILNQPKQYASAVSHIQRALWLRTAGLGGPRVTLTDCKHPKLSPLSSQDLCRMALERSMGPVGEWLEKRLIQHLLSRKTRCLGISLQYLSQALPAMALAGAVKQMAPEVKIVVGGALVSSWAKLGGLPRLSPWVDLLIPGRNLNPLAQILGVEPQRLNADLPVPEFRGFPWGYYLSPQRVAPMFTSLGCYWGRCSFCPEAEERKNFRSIAPEAILDRMGKIVNQTQAQWIHITDNAIPPKSLASLAKADLGVRWFGFARFEPILCSKELADELYGSGCRMLQLGLESGSARILERLGKGTDLGVVSRILANLHRAGIATYVYVLFGIPGETLEDARETMNFVADNAESIDYLHCSILNLPRAGRFPGDLELRELGGGQGHDLSLYTGFLPAQGMDRKAARLFLQREFSKQPRISEILRRDPPAFTSAHAALFHSAGARAK